MLNKEQELREFRDAFSFLKGKRVVLYGTGQYTELILRETWEFRIVGLMDRNRAGETCFGLPVLGEEALPGAGCEAVIIVSNLSTAPEIYGRLRGFCGAKGIAVYYMNGRNPADTDFVPGTKAWKLRSCGGIMAAAAGYDVISFDLFDTLIMRKCLFPEDIFSLTEARAKEAGIELSDFPRRRMEAEKTLYHSGQLFYNLDDIYSWLKGIYAWSESQAAAVKALELALELELAVPRSDMAACFRALKGAGKRVVVTTDMYLSREQLEPLLAKCGLADAELYLSNACKASKYIGTLFDRLREDFPGKRILHLGDNPLCDVENAAGSGIDALLIPSAAAWMKYWELDASNRYLHALFAQRCFSSAFQEKEGKICISSVKDLGYLFFGPLAAGYLLWLADQAAASKVRHLLFISRDGYLFYKLYEKLRGRRAGLPGASYFLTSRRCASVASLQTAEDARFIFDEICYSKEMRIGEMLEKVFGIPADADDPEKNAARGELGSQGVWEHIEARYMPRILARAAEERRGYARYIAALGLPSGRLGMMNFVGRGVTQRCLQRLLDREMIGYYAAMEYDAVRILHQGTECLSWYPERLSTHTGRRKLAEQLLLGETVFSAPCGAVVSFSEEGRPVYEPESPERSKLIAGCHQGIEEFVEDIMQIAGGRSMLLDMAGGADRVFGWLCDGRFAFSDEIRTGFQFEDRYQSV